MAISVELSVPMLFGLKVTFNDIKTIYDGLIGRINEDKDAICLGLYIINVHVAGWYGDIITRFSFIPSGENIKFSNEDKANLVQFIKKRERTDLAEKSLVMLDVLKERYNSNERDVRLKQDIKDKLDLTVIENIRNYLEEFMEIAINTKNNWLLEFRNNDDTWSITPSNIDKWEEELNRLRRDLNMSITKQLMRLKSSHASSKKLFDELRPSTP